MLTDHFVLCDVWFLCSLCACYRKTTSIPTKRKCSEAASTWY